MQVELCLLLPLLVAYIAAEPNNICRTYLGYINMNQSSDCWYEPDVGATTMQMLRNHGYSGETHEIVTEDGYILTAFRVVSNNVAPRRPVVLIHHGFTSDSSYFTCWGNNSMAFLLTEWGYDVWLANARGSQYSRGHVNASISQSNYWYFSFHEMGYYDLPATLELISYETGSTDIIYIGHSMGTTVSFIYGSLKPLHAKKYLKAIISICPIAYMAHVTSDVSILAPFKDLIKAGATATQTYAFNEDLSVTKAIGVLCPKYPEIYICIKSIFAAFGQDYDQMTPEIPIRNNDVLSSTSIKSAEHFAQIVNAKGRFQQFDYGCQENILRYGNCTPPIYDVTLIPVPMRMFYGKADKLAAEQDVLFLGNVLRNNDVVVTKIPVNSSVNYNHIDFQSAKDNNKLFMFPTFMEVLRVLSNERR